MRPINPHKLDTFTGTIGKPEALHRAFELSPNAATDDRMTRLIEALQQHHYTLQDSDGERSIFECLPGKGCASVTLTTVESMDVTGYTTSGSAIHEYKLTSGFDVVISHPEMYEGRGEVHACIDHDQVLAVLATVADQ